ncbi:sulfotransferase [Maricaulis sp.]|uniref:tetratricopeptide repeat-containing sulfotransferase family protein n=1 Tax=Maricaulis sp. TaxID=1486257 RepID=UPI003A8CCCE5
MTETAAEFMREGQALLAGGSQTEACLAFCRALDREPRLVAAHYNLGAVLLMSGRAREGLPCLMTAAMLQPGVAQLIIALARALVETGEAGRAASLLAKACREQPGDAALREASAQCPPPVTMDGRLDGFATRIAAAEGNAMYAEAMAAHEAGRVGEAYSRASELVWIAPQSVAVWSLLAETALLAGHGDHAEMCARRALAITPKNAQCWAVLARMVGEAEGRADDACPIWQAALNLDPVNLELFAQAASWHDRHLDPEAMLALIETARRAGADFTRPDLLDVQARAQLRAGKLEAAHASIKQSLAGPGEPDQLRSRHFTRGAIADKLGQYREAHAAFLDGNALLEAVWEQDGPCDHTMVTRRIESLHRRLDAEIASGQSAVADSGEGPDNIAFLVGFPRSGTTLLDTILRSHSRVSVVEEKRVLGDALRSVVGGMSGDESNFTEDWLDRLELSDTGVLRASYLEQMARHAGEPLASDRVYIDKLPLNMNWAPLIHRLFPRAVFILAGRHPLDVAISNLAQDFKPNNAMLNMTSLARIDRLYDLSFSLWEAFEAWREPVVERIAYEGLIQDLEASVTPLMQRLGLEFEPAQARYFETARQRGRINTPSANQVTQTLYATSRERWRHYDFAFEGEDSGHLRAWAKRMGYAIA